MGVLLLAKIPLEMIHGLVGSIKIIAVFLLKLEKCQVSENSTNANLNHIQDLFAYGIPAVNEAKNVSEPLAPLGVEEAFSRSLKQTLR